MESTNEILERMGWSWDISTGSPVTRTSKHAKGRQRPRGWHSQLRTNRKSKKLARRKNR